MIYCTGLRKGFGGDKDTELGFPCPACLAAEACTSDSGCSNHVLRAAEADDVLTYLPGDMALRLWYLRDLREPINASAYVIFTLVL